MSNIPEGATHTAPDGTYRMVRGSLWYGYADGDWVYIEGASPHNRGIATGCNERLYEGSDP
jgi:hypothetical protein